MPEEVKGERLECEVWEERRLKCRDQFFDWGFGVGGAWVCRGGRWG